MKKMILNVFWTFLASIVVSIGIALTLKSGVGVGSLNALSTTISELVPLKVGTMLMSLNVFFVFVQLLIQKKDFHWRQWLQVGLSIVLGEVVNVFYYSIFQYFNVDNYLVAILLFLLGLVLCAFGVAALIQLNLVVFPYEAVSSVIAQKLNRQFKDVRQFIDGAVIALIIALTFVFSLNWSLREGTIINFFIFPAMTQYAVQTISKQGWFEAVRID